MSSSHLFSILSTALPPWSLIEPEGQAVTECNCAETIFAAVISEGQPSMKTNSFPLTEIGSCILLALEMISLLASVLTVNDEF